MAQDKHPPVPGPVVQPNFLPVLEALREVTFPISKRDLLEQIGDDGTAMMDGRNVDLHTLIKDIHDDYFEDEAELSAALERHYARTEETELLDGTHGSLPQPGDRQPWRAPGEAASPDPRLEPSSE